MSNRFHNKFHRQNHHSDPTPGYPDSAMDPIASFEQPFKGEFYSQGDIITTENLSAKKYVYADDGVIHNSLTVKGNFTVLGITSQLDTLVYTTSAVNITNAGTGPALTVTQTGSEPIAHFIDSNGDDIIFADNGYVGLGVTSPSEKLTIAGNLSSSGTATIGTIVTGATNSVLIQNAGLIQKRDINPQIWDTTARFVSASDGALTVNRLPKAATSNGINESIVFDDGTNVGIGIDTPGAKLTVSGTLSASGTATIGTIATNSTGTSFVVETAGLLQKRGLNTAALDTTSKFVSASDGALTVNRLTKAENSNGIDESIVYDDGTNVGIRTDNPSTTLHISGSDGLVIPVGNTSQRVNVKGAIRYNSQDQVFEGYDGANWGSLGGVKDVNQDTYISAEDFPGINNDELKFFTFDEERMRILSGGNIGIGLSAANEKLTVSGNISAIGNIYANIDIAPTTVLEFVVDNAGKFEKRLLALADVPQYTFTKNLTVSIDPTKSFGRYKNKDIIQSLGKTVGEVIEMAVVEPITPGIQLSATSPQILFNQTNITNTLAFSHQISSLGAVAASGIFEWKRNNESTWQLLSSSTATSGTLVHNTTNTAFNTNAFNYKYTVVDTVGASASATANTSMQLYQAPSVSFTSPAADTRRDKGDTTTTVSGTITQNRVNVPITKIQLQRSVDSGTWTNVGPLTSFSTNPASYNFSYIDSDASVVNASTIVYRLSSVDDYQSNTSGNSNTVNLLHRNAILYSSNTSITINDIYNVPLTSHTNSTQPSAVLLLPEAFTTRTVNGVTAGSGRYTYFCYGPSTISDLTAITQLPSTLVTDSFKSSISPVSPFTISGTSPNGANVSYKVYKTNAPDAFTNANLKFDR